MQTKQCNNATEKERVIETVADILFDLLANDESKDLASVETELTEILLLARKCTTEKYFEANDPSQHYCSKCGEKMIIKEKRTRKIIGLSPYQFHRRIFHCPVCNQYERPLDDMIGVSGQFSFEVRKAMLLLGQRIPFQEASDYLDKLLHVQVSNQSILSTVETVGKQVHQEDQAMIRKTLNKEGFPESLPTSDKKIVGAAYLQMDGMMVQTREEGWKEIRNGVLFSEHHKARLDKHHQHISEKVCFSVFNRNKNSLAAFKRRATAEAYHFEFDRYEKPVIIGDGASWIWDYANEYHPEAIQILDYYHACEYLGEALTSLESSAYIKTRRFSELSDGNVKKVLRFLKKQTNTKEVSDCIRYFTNHEQRMHYGKYVDQGLDIGSGAIESTHRTLIQSRMKQAGMHWKKQNVQSIASVKARYHSGRWEEMVNKHLKAA